MATETRDAQELKEVNDFYEQIGLGTDELRAQFNMPSDQEAPKVLFDVMISNTSTPFSR